MKHIFTAFFFIIAVFSVPLFAAEDEALIKEVRGYAARREYSNAYMALRSYVQSFPESKKRCDALLAMAEYDYFSSNHTDAVRVLERLLPECDNSSIKVFAYAYLLQIARINGDELMVKDLERSIVKFMQVSLLFRDYKSYRYRSMLLRRYKVIYFIDKVEFYVDGALLTSFSY